MINIKQTLMTVSAIGTFLAFSMSASATSSVIYADPVPGSTEPGVCNGGISYEWTVKMGSSHTAIMSAQKALTNRLLPTSHLTQDGHIRLTGSLLN